MESKYSLKGDGGLIDNGVPNDILHRCELINTKVYPNEYAAIKYVADLVTDAINTHSSENGLFTLGLTTGNTPIGLYRELVSRYNEGKVSFKGVRVFSIDEFYPIEKGNIHSRNYKIHEDFLNFIDILPENIHILDGIVPIDSISDYCLEYDNLVGNVDFMILGVGPQGQVGFNDVASNPKMKTRLVQLTYKARIFQSSRFNNPDSVPKMAITMGLGTIMRSKKIVIMAWGEEKAAVIRKIVEEGISELVPASYLQNHPDIQVVVDKNGGQMLTIEKTPWLVGHCLWTRKFIRRAVIWLCDVVNKPILELTYEDYIENYLGELVEFVGSYDKVNIDVFNDIQHTITGWPGGKPNADDSLRPVPATPFPKRVLIFSPHPDDDVISMGGTFHRLIVNGHDVHVAYQTSGNVAVSDDNVLQNIDTAKEMGLIWAKSKDEPEETKLRDIKSGIRRAEAKAAVRVLGLNDHTNVHFLNLPFYETGCIKKRDISDEDIEITVRLLRKLKPDQIYAAGDFSDPHGTHRICIEVILSAMERVSNDDWVKNCVIWLYRGAWQEWDFGVVDMAVPLSPDEMIKKRHSIFKHLSQKDIMPFPGADTREFWQRAEERTQNTAKSLNKLGLAKYQAMELFVRLN